MIDLHGYKGFYSVNSAGIIFNNETGKKITQCKNSRGYAVIVLCKNGVKKTESAHRLVCFTFKPTTYFDGAFVNHIDGNKMNNSPGNLEWVTGSQNMIHAYRTGLQTVSDNQRVATAKYCVDNYSKKVIQKDTEGNIIKEFISASEAARQTGFCQTHISSVCRGKVKTCHNFKFEYVPS